MSGHDPLCACELREHSCENHWAGTHCTKCECHKIARVRADERAKNAPIVADYEQSLLADLRAKAEGLPSWDVLGERVAAPLRRARPARRGRPVIRAALLGALAGAAAVVAGTVWAVLVDAGRRAEK